MAVETDQESRKIRSILKHTSSFEVAADVMLDVPSAALSADLNDSSKIIDHGVLPTAPKIPLPPPPPSMVPKAPLPPPPSSPGLSPYGDNSDRRESTENKVARSKLHWKEIKNIAEGSIWEELESKPLDPITSGFKLDIQKFEGIY